MERNKHVKGDPRCKACCCGTERCEEDGCDGLWHQIVVDEINWGDADWSWVHNYKCDKCGHEQYFSDYEGHRIEFEEEE
jgi:hypothetical protein